LLFALAEHERDATVLVRSSSRLAEVEIAKGRIVRVSGVESEPLGDTLLRKGTLDCVRHGEALAEEPPEGPVGEWLVHVGAAAREAVDGALREQLHARMVDVFSWAQPHVTLVAHRAHSDAELSCDLVLAVWEGLCALARSHGACATSPSRAPGITRRGLRILSLLRARGVPVDAPNALSANARMLLVLLGAVGGREFDAETYSLLLRKQREIRRRASAAELLDVPECASPDEARRAFKRLASRLHPDRFQSDAPELFALSSDVLRALASAEALLRGARKAG
jgi:hypothetical protein